MLHRKFFSVLRCGGSTAAPPRRGRAPRVVPRGEFTSIIIVEDLNLEPLEPKDIPPRADSIIKPTKAYTTMAAQVDLGNSNISDVGSAADAAARQAAAKTEEDWAGAGTKVGIEVWRVENARKADGSPDFGVNPWPKEQTGQFCVGDSYIMLQTYKPKKDSEALA